MSRNYKFHNPEGVYFVSFAVIEWLEIFTEKKYLEILLSSLRYSQKEKGLELYAWCIMPNHVHLIFSSKGIRKPEQLFGDIKRFTSKALVKAISEETTAENRDYLLNKFASAASKSSNVKQFQFWQHDNHPIELWSNKVIDQKLNYIHNNPVTAGLVQYPEQYLYSSARDYAGEKGLLDIILI